MRITVRAESSAPPEQVLALAGTDFSTRRAEIWPNVTEKGVIDSNVLLSRSGLGEPELNQPASQRQRLRSLFARQLGEYRAELPCPV